MNPKCELTINNITLGVHLGCTPEEARVPQAVELTIRLRFARPIKAIDTDDLNDTFCYDRLIQEIKGTLADRHFKLVERLGHFVFQIVKSKVDSSCLVEVQTRKVLPPVPEIKGGVTFICGDLI